MRPKKWPAARALFAVFWLFLVSFIFAAKTAITVGRLFEDKQLRVVWFCRLPLSKLEDWAQSVFNRLATPSLLLSWESFLGERQGLSAIFSFRLNLAARERAGLYLSIFRANICKAGMGRSALFYSLFHQQPPAEVGKATIHSFQSRQ